jgi:uncharacterized membrane protein
VNGLLWVLAGLLAAAFLGSGIVKLTRTREELAEAGMAWVEDFSADTVRVIGTLEILAAVGLVVPALIGIAAVLVPVAAVGLAALMLGAVITHMRRGEPEMVVTTLVLMALAALLAWGRFGPYSFSS